jgi:ribosome-binding protein aMBF1 (putative translation factor)
MDGQDWTPVILRSSTKTSQGQRTGPEVSAAVKAQRKLDTPDIVVPKFLTIESVQKIQEYRRLTSKTQVQLDQALAFPAKTMNGLESRRLTPSSQQLSKLKRLIPGLTLV